MRPLVGRNLTGLVITVVDGDTIRVRLDTGKTITVRFDGIDTPEIREPFYAEARNATRVLMFDKRVDIRGTDVDPYDRLVGRVRIGATDASVRLVRDGLACHFLRYSSDPALATAQSEAKRKGSGFWAADAQQPGCVAANDAFARARGLGTGALAAAHVGPFHGNTQSRIYHAPSCENYTCKNCTSVFATEADAKREGYHPAGDCLGH